MRIAMLVASLWLVTSPLWGKIVFHSNRDSNWDIYTMNSDGSNQTRLTFNEAGDSFPAWSPNGRQIAFSSQRDSGGRNGEINSEIYVMDADGTNQRRLTHYPGIDGDPEWSPDSTQIAFSSTRAAKEGERKLEIYVMDADGSNVKQVTNAGFAQRPKWSPDGEWILFMDFINHGIYAIRPDGTDLWQVSTTRFGASMHLGGWSPDGSQVLYIEAINHSPDNSFPVIATLTRKRQLLEVVGWRHIKVPRMPFQAASFSADGKAILFTDRHNIYRFELIGHRLIQLTDNPGAFNTAAQEWDSRLSVSRQQRLLAQTWGRIKATTMSK